MVGTCIGSNPIPHNLLITNDHFEDYLEEIVACHKYILNLRQAKPQIMGFIVHKKGIRHGT